MSKKISVIAVLLVSSVTWAGGIGQIQDFTAALGNGVSLLHGSQGATSDNFLTVLNNQCAGAQCFTFATQEQIGFFSQVGSADGMCALIGVEQTIMGLGVQSQTIADGVGTKLQGQNLGLLAAQGVAKADGGGAGTANQVMSISQDQMGLNTLGPAHESSVVFGVQTASIQGAPGATGMAGGTIGVTTNQAQVVN